MSDAIKVAVLLACDACGSAVDDPDQGLCAKCRAPQCIARKRRPMLTIEEMAADREPTDPISDHVCEEIDGAPWFELAVTA